jgi:hypothetical protein
MAHIRPFVAGDVPQVAALHRKVFKTADRADSGPESYQAYFSRVFLDTPAYDHEIPSLVCEEEDGAVVGFLGVVPRRMTVNGQHFRAAISSQFIVDPSCRSGFVAVGLAKAFLGGRQDLSISDEASDISRRIWEGLGGTTSLWHSMRWTRPLRPTRFALSFLRERSGMAPLATAAEPLARLADALVARLARGRLYLDLPHPSRHDELCETVFLSHLPGFAGPQNLSVEYDARTFRWLLDLARRRKASGRLHTAIVRKLHTVMGWYVFHIGDDRTAEVLQIAADTATMPFVLDRLFAHAAKEGAIAVSGRLEPRFLQSFSDKHCVFHMRGPWVLVNARRPDLLRSFQAGDTFFSRFDGEWCLGF